MDFSFSINCINYHEPLLWFSLAVGSVVGWLTASLLVTLSRRVKLPMLFVIVGAVIGAAPLAVISSFIVLALLYGFIRAGAVCIHFVRPAFLLPAALSIVSLFRRAGLLQRASNTA